VLDRIETQAESGDWIPAKTRWGSHPIGVLSYDSAGNMAVQIMRRDRAPLSSHGLAEAQSVSSEALALAPAEEKAAAFDGYTAYFGKYSVREAEGLVTHQRIGHLVPNQATLSVERHFEFLDDALVLAVPCLGECRPSSADKRELRRGRGLRSRWYSRLGQRRSQLSARSVGRRKSIG
jgi:hypothetical protein